MKRIHFTGLVSPLGDVRQESALSPVVAILGCTGCGKSAVGRELARQTDGEIVSLDSMKVYRRMDIGTAKPDARTRREIPHHLIDVVEPTSVFSVADYVERAERAMAAIHGRGKPVWLVGGTALYLKALTHGLFEGPGADRDIRARLRDEARKNGSAKLHERLQQVDPIAAGRIHLNDLRRIIRALEVYELTGRPISALQAQWEQAPTRHEPMLIGLRRELEDQNHRTNDRVRRMIASGLVDEVRSLLAGPKPLSLTARRALGYAEIIEHLEGRVSLAEAVEMIKIKTRQFAKAQRTWFKRFEHVYWVDLKPETTVGEIVDGLLTKLMNRSTS